jgi:hypothetical protein
MKLKYLLFLGCILLAARFAAADTNSAPAAAAEAGGFSGKVVETLNAAGYTYVLVDTGAKKLWAVTTTFPVKIGDTAKVGAGMPMENYHSKSLNRDFDVVYFTAGIEVNGAAAGGAPALPPGHPPLTGTNQPGLPPGHPSLTSPGAAPKVDLTGIKKAQGGKTIQEIYAAKAKIAGKPTAVRGKVVKYNAQIMGKNWLHIQDGSGSADDGNNDLTVTTSTPAAVGDTVLVIGLASTDRDFGAGYKYGIILEDAKVIVEQP